MSERLTLTSEAGKWYPLSVHTLEVHISVFIKQNSFFTSDEIKPIIKNLAYSLQYIEFLNRIIIDIKLSEVLWTQNVKSFVVHGASIIESIFNFLVISNNEAKTLNFQQVSTSTTNEYTIDSKKYKNEIIILEKVSTPIISQMTFDQLAKKVESKKLLGQNFSNYSRVKPLRQLRNKIHIHDAEHSSDTDWHNFNHKEYMLIREVLYSVLTSEIFNGSTYMDKFEYLK